MSIAPSIQPLLKVRFKFSSSDKIALSAIDKLHLRESADFITPDPVNKFLSKFLNFGTLIDAKSQSSNSSSADRF